MLAALLLLGLAGCGADAAGADEGPRNVILISIDTLRPDFLGCYGHERDTSPAIDRLASGGVRFTDVSSAAPWTLPSHATMFTGLYPSHHGVKSHDNRLPDRVVTLAEEFRDRGFQTFAVVNTWNIAEPSFHLFQGFDADDLRYIAESIDNPRTQKDIVGGGEAITTAARELLEERDEGQSFFLFLHTYDVHTDFNPKPEYKERFVGPYSGRLNGRTQQLIGMRKRGETLTEADLRWLKEMYEAEIRELDDLLDRFFDWLEEQGLAEDTLIVLTSDHGEEFQEHGGTLHGRTQYQELLLVPLILKGPGLPQGQVIDAPVSLIDLAPTILALCGIEPSQELDGLDISRAWRDPAGFPRDRRLFGEADHNNEVDGRSVVDIKRMVRRGNEKLVLDRHTKRFELYDLARDPSEQTDLSGAQPERMKELKRELGRFMQSEVDPEMIAPPSAEDLERLEELGYAGGGERLPAEKPEPEKPR